MKKKILSLFTTLAMLCVFICIAPITEKTYASTDVSNLYPVDSTYNFIKKVEGFDPECFWDVAQWTIGYGNKCPYTHSSNGTKNGQKGGHTITESYARELFDSKLPGYVNTLKSNCKGLSMNQNQFDALLSATYNHGNVNYCPLKYYLQGKLTESQAREQYYVWCINAGTSDEQGLRNRRKEEADLFFKDIKEENLPIGVLDVLESPGHGKIRVAGWVYDKDDLSESINVHVYVGGKAGSETGHCYIIGNADHDSSDLVSNGIPGKHRFDMTFSVSETGVQQIYLYGINIGSGNTNPCFAEGIVSIGANLPIGAVDVLESPEPGKLRVAGWAYDTDDLTKSIGVHVYVGGLAGSKTGHCYDIGLADHKSSDLVANGVPGNHRFDTTISVSETDIQQVYLYAINIDKGNTNPCFAQGTVLINSPLPIGAADIISSPENGKIRVAGWAYDYDDLNESLSIHVYVGGKAGSETGHCYVINADHESSDLVINGISGNHRFDSTIDVSEIGKQDIYIYAINIKNGNTNPMIANNKVEIKTKDMPVTTKTTTTITSATSQLPITTTISSITTNTTIKPVTTTTQTEITMPKPVKTNADLNADGKINTADIVEFQKIALKKYNDIAYIVDLNGDGVMNVFDMIILKRTVLAKL